MPITTNCSLINEFYALILLFILALFFYNVKPMRGFAHRRRIFGWSMALCALSILLNILCEKLAELPFDQPTELMMTLNMLYFFVTWLMLSVLGYYLLMRLFEFVYDVQALRRALYILGGIFVVFTALLMLNMSSGFLFFVDNAGNYCRGPFNVLLYLMPISEVALIVGCYFFFRRSINRIAGKMVFVIAPVSLMLLLLQFAYQDHQMNGIICVTVHMIVFITYNGGRTEQDSVTGMENRRYLTTEINYRIKNKQSFQMVMAKLRCLSQINRLYGENAGDVILLEIGEALQHLSEDGKVYRRSDEEFVLLYSNIDEELCVQRLRRMTQLMSDEWLMGKYVTSLSFQTIEMRYSGQPWTFDDVSGYMSDAMHYASVNEVVEMPFDEQLISSHKRRDYLLQAIREGLVEDRFEVWYQPVFYHKSGKFESAEALIRMFDADGTMISPGEFIPVCEETGLIDEITAIVLDEVCRLLNSGTVPELKTISINTPVRQITDDQARQRLHGIVEEHGVDPERIRLEVTERDVAQGGESAVDAMSFLREAGYSFMLDDFGIDYSNISRMMDLSLDCIKLDRSLVLQMQKDERRHNMIKNYLVPFLHNLGHYVVAEGVETAEMLELVLSCDINRIQGYFYAKPMPEHQLIRWFQEQVA